MKQCPECKTAYTDESLKFCLADGAVLTHAADEEPTRIRTPATASTAPGQGGSPVSHPIGASSLWIKIAVSILLIGIFALGAVGLIATFFYYNGRSIETRIPDAAPLPANTANAATPTPDAEKERMRAELANIQKRLDDQGAANQNNRPSSAPPDQTLGITVTANSPADGFLALRSEPDSDTGRRIAKIPHGQHLRIGACGDYITTKKNNYGRWCRASYNGYSGWVFDKYVIY